MWRTGLLASLSLLASVQGCSPWVTHQVSPAQLPTLRADGIVRVTRRDDRYIDLQRAHFANDSLVGEYDSPPKRWAIAVADIKRLEERDGARGNSDAAAGAAVGAALGVGAAAVVLGLIGVAALLASLMAAW